MPTTITEANVSVIVPDGVVIPVDAGSLSPKQMQRTPKARRSVGATAVATADAMRKHPDRLVVPQLTADALETAGVAADRIDLVIVDLEVVLQTLKQANLLLDAEAHEHLRRVLAAVRAAEKFDRTVTELVPQLIRYFSNERGEGEPEGGTR